MVSFTHVDPAWGTWLVGLLAVWAVLLFGGFLFGRINADGTRRMPTWTRMGSSLAVALAAWSIVYVTDQAGARPGLVVAAALVAVGMTLGLLGDLFLATVLPVSNPTLAGMAAFGLGHVSYIAGFLTLGNVVGVGTPDSRPIALGVWLLVGALGWYLVVARGHPLGALQWAALPYALLLSGTAGAATGFALQTALFIPLAAGAALFLLSDLILAAQLFNHVSFPLIGDVIWLTYGPAQALIVYGVAFALFSTR